MHPFHGLVVVFSWFQGDKKRSLISTAYSKNMKYCFQGYGKFTLVARLGLCKQNKTDLRS